MRADQTVRVRVVGALILTVAVIAACAQQSPPAATDTEAPAETASDEASEQPTLEQREADLAAREAEVAERERKAAEDQAKQNRPPAPRPAAPAPPPAPTTVDVTLAAATPIEIEFISEVSSETAAVDDTFRARVTKDVTDGTRIVIPAGSEVGGRVTEAVSTKKFGGQARLGLAFDSLDLPSGQSVPIQASLMQAGKKQAGRDAAAIGGSAAAGALLGRIVSKKDRDKGTVIGAVVGAAVGTAVAAEMPGDPVVIGPGAVTVISLESPLTLTVES